MENEETPDLKITLEVDFTEAAVILAALRVVGEMTNDSKVISCADSLQSKIKNATK